MPYGYTLNNETFSCQIRTYCEVLMAYDKLLARMNQVFVLVAWVSFLTCQRAADVELRAVLDVILVFGLK